MMNYAIIPKFQLQTFTMQTLNCMLFLSGYAANVKPPRRPPLARGDIHPKMARTTATEESSEDFATSTVYMCSVVHISCNVLDGIVLCCVQNLARPHNT